ncbi:MAG TPA: response regulator [Verrucomicrobiae bacterium]|nr:response regulator [Verrucomicrobiae bacterium]
MAIANDSNTKAAKSILLVEDSDNDALLFERSLRRIRGLNIVGRVKDAQSAIGYLKGEGQFDDRKHYPYPDIVILDLAMPNSDGFQLLQWAQHRKPRPVLAVFTGLADEPARRRAELLGADLYENKAWDPEVFDRFIHFVTNIADVKKQHNI